MAHQLSSEARRATRLDSISRAEAAFSRAEAEARKALQTATAARDSAVAAADEAADAAYWAASKALNDKWQDEAGHLVSAYMKTGERREAEALRAAWNAHVREANECLGAEPSPFSLAFVLADCEIVLYAMEHRSWVEPLSALVKAAEHPFQWEAKLKEMVAVVERSTRFRKPLEDGDEMIVGAVTGGDMSDIAENRHRRRRADEAIAQAARSPGKNQGSRAEEASLWLRHLHQGRVLPLRAER